MAKQEETKSTKEDKIAKCRVTTPMFRVSYPHLWKASGLNKSAPKYSVTMLFKKDDDLSAVKRAMLQAKINKFGKDKEQWPEDIESPVVDGDSKKNKDKDGYKGHWAIKASSSEDQKPYVVDQDVEPITEQSDMYPGCYAMANVLAYVWEYPENSGNFGVGFILNGVQKVKEGKPFGNKKSAKDVFAPIDADEFGDDESEDSDDGEDFF